ncbi:MAG: hypothetical protein IT439_00945 [Phycisphaerales bacterium]|nr:hypothetical protein [Phycisphaerales bacterium]
MTTNTSSPTGMFLGIEAAAGGPFALLGIAPGACTDRAVLAALQAQLDRVDGHIQAETPQADEVRLALHAAAAQLLDPSVRQLMVARWSAAEPAPANRSGPGAHPTWQGDSTGRRVEGTARASEGGSVDGAAGRTPPGALLAIEQDMIRLIARNGGWGPRTLREVALFAHARGFDVAQVPEAIRVITARRRAGGSGGGAPARFASPAGHDAPSGAVREAGFTGPRTSGVRRRSAAAAPMATAGTAPEPATGRGLIPDGEGTDEHAPDPVRRIAVWTGLVVFCVLSATGILLAVLPLLKDDPGSASPGAAGTPTITVPGRPETASGPGRTLKPVDPAPEPATPADRPMTAAEALALVRTSTEGLAIDPEQAATDFERAVLRLGEVWCDLPRDQRVAGVDQIVEYVYRASAWADIASSGVETIAGPSMRLRLAGKGLAPDEVWPAIWSVGVLTRLSRERDLTSGAVSVIDASLTGALGGGRAALNQTFDAGALAALAEATRLLASPGDESSPTNPRELLDSWRRWIRAIDAVAGTDPSVRNRLLLSGLDAILREGPAPETHRPTFDAGAAVAGAVDWSDAVAARPWLIFAFSAPSISTPDLFIVTSAIVRQGKTEGVDTSMVLPASAGDQDRQMLRERYARLWGDVSEEREDELADLWREALGRLEAGRRSDTTPAEFLASAVRLARLNLAAEQRWYGRFEDAGNLLGDLSGPVDAEFSGTSEVSRPLDPGADTSWAVDYLSTNNAELRIQKISEVGSRGRYSQMTAEVLVFEATRSQRDRVRQAAYDAVFRETDQPTVVNALLEQLPDIPGSRRNTALVGRAALLGSLSPDDDRWRLRARRALVERLTQMLASTGEFAIVDRLGEIMSETYAARTSITAPTAASRAGLPRAEFSAALLRQSWRRRAEGALANPSLGFSLGEIERRRTARLALAEGPVQLFATEQFAVLDLMAFVLASERPDLVPAIRAAIEECAGRRRLAEHILEQISATELAMSVLWDLRLSGGTP